MLAKTSSCSLRHATPTPPPSYFGHLSALRNFTFRCCWQRQYFYLLANRNKNEKNATARIHWCHFAGKYFGKVHKLCVPFASLYFSFYLMFVLLGLFIYLFISLDAFSPVISRINCSKCHLAFRLHPLPRYLFWPQRGDSKSCHVIKSKPNVTFWRSHCRRFGRHARLAMIWFCICILTI